MIAQPAPRESWAGAWIDAGAFALGLGLAWTLKWRTTDLVWSLWLSSLVVGYALILWFITAPLRELVINLHADRSGLAGAGAKSAVIALFGAGTLFGLVFFTVHFGAFHVGHSFFLNMLFPVTETPARGFFDWAIYREVFARYWIFLPAALLAERHLFRRPIDKPDLSVTAAAIAARKARGDAMALPYRGVIRMHVLIVFFVGAHFAGLDDFIVYAVVYAVYFFPWRLLRRREQAGVVAG
jgi:hypothetical protein